MVLQNMQQTSGFGNLMDISMAHPPWCVFARGETAGPIMGIWSPSLSLNCHPSDKAGYLILGKKNMAWWGYPETTWMSRWKLTLVSAIYKLVKVITPLLAI